MGVFVTDSVRIGCEFIVTKLVIQAKIFRWEGNWSLEKERSMVLINPRIILA
jgi:hypothetical protein